MLAARHERDGDVVLKIVHPRTDPEAVRREDLAVQQIQSPRVPRILDHGTAITNVGTAFGCESELSVLGRTVRTMLGKSRCPPQTFLSLAYM